MIYSDEEFLISELIRFERENDRTPIAHDMIPENGYPGFWVYQKVFGTWNNALIAAGFEINQTNDRRTGLETCCKCGDYLKQGRRWITKGLSEGEVICGKCNHNTDYMNNNLDKNSNTGKAFISQRVVFNVIILEEKYDCNCEYDFNHPMDLYHKDKYKYINVKDSKLHNKVGQNPFWQFDLSQEVTPDTYVMLGYDYDRKNILHVWITDAVDDLVFNDKTEKLLKYKSITNIPDNLVKAKPWEVDPKPYNDMLHKMSQKRKDNNGIGCILDSSDLNMNNDIETKKIKNQ